MLTLSRKAGEAIHVGDTVKITLIGKDGDQVLLGLEVKPSPPAITPKPALSRSWKALFEKVNIFVSMARPRRFERITPNRLQFACQRAIEEYPGGIRTFIRRFDLSLSFEQRLFYGSLSEITADEFAVILKATRSQHVVEALADLLQ